MLEDVSRGPASHGQARFEAVLLPYSYLAVDPVQAHFQTKNAGGALS